MTITRALIIGGILLIAITLLGIDAGSTCNMSVNTGGGGSGGGGGSTRVW